MKVTIKAPTTCNRTELDNFEALVRKGEEVAGDGLAGRIRNAAFLMFLTLDDGSLIGVSGLKRPNAGYRANVFRHAQSTLRPDDFVLELGWIYIVDSERDKKLSRVLVEKLLPYANNDRLYATTRELNAGMIKTNERYGFRREGKPYQSENGEYNLLLFVH